MKAPTETPTIIEGGLAIDDRGTLSFANGFSLGGIRRFYQISNFSTHTIRAFHGHMKEDKYFYVASGTVLAAAVEIDNTKKPSKNKKVERFVLSAKKPCLLHIPAGYANGFKALEEHTILIVFSTSSLEESKGDDYRFPHNYWGDDVWNIENR